MGGRAGERDVSRGGGVDPIVGYRGGIKTTDPDLPSKHSRNAAREFHDGIISPGPLLHREMLASVAYSPSKPEGSLIDSLPRVVGRREVSSCPLCPRQRPVHVAIYPESQAIAKPFYMPGNVDTRKGSAAGDARGQPPHS